MSTAPACPPCIDETASVQQPTPVNAPTDSVDQLLKAAIAIEQFGTLAAAPFNKSTAGQQAEQSAIGTFNYGISLLPLLGDLFHGIGSLFHHAHKQAGK